MNEIQKTEEEIYQLVQKLDKLRAAAPLVPVKNYTFRDLSGERTLLELFGHRDTLLAIHNMGQGCRFCTLWGDGLSAFLPHLESALSVVMFSKDDPETQRTFANSRQWRFRMLSHGGGAYIQEQSVAPGKPNEPGVVCYVRKGQEIFRKNVSQFGPGDLFCSHWHLLSMAGLGEGQWVPQYNYWKRPEKEKMDDGGNNLL